MSTKVALITGAARRIGREIASFLHGKGLNVVVHFCSSGTEAQSLVKELNQRRHNSAKALMADLNNIEQCQKLIIDACNSWNRLDVLVNNASRFYPTLISETNDNQWQDLINCNVKAPYFLSVCAAPLLRMQQGCIINIADIHGVRPLKNYPIYSMSKAALIMSTQALAKELAPEIRVNAIAPGSILWPEGINALSPLKQENIISKTLLKRQGCPEDIARAVWFFINDGEYVTGQILAVDGGRGAF